MVRCDFTLHHARPDTTTTSLPIDPAKPPQLLYALHNGRVRFISRIYRVWIARQNPLRQPLQPPALVRLLLVAEY
jgi:hypothetical protein